MVEGLAKTAAVATFLSLLGFVRPVAGQPTTSDEKLQAKYQRVHQLYKQLYYSQAMAVCKKALLEGKNSRRELIYLLGFKGLIEAAMGKREQAVDAFKQMLVIDPRSKLAVGQPPRVEQAFDDAQKWIAKHGALSVAISAPEKAARDATVQIGLTVVSDPYSMAGHAVLHLRPSGTKLFSARSSRGEAISWEIRLDVLEGIDRADALEYYVVVYDPDQNEVMLFGSSIRPRRIGLPTAKPAVPPLVVRAVNGTEERPAPSASGHTTAKPWFKRWRLWAVVSTIFVAVTVGTAVAISAGSSSGAVDLPVSIGVR